MTFHLEAAPIIEAVLDIDCDMPPTMDVASLESSSRAAFLDQYPKFQTQFMQELQFETKNEGAAKVTSHHGVQALQFLQDDGKQLVQVRAQGFSFNRLAPYGSLDDYLPEMERTWRLFVDIAKPVQIRVIRLRYINRILLPMTSGRVELNDYLALGPHLPDEGSLTFIGFVNQHSAVEAGTGNQVNVVLATQPQENDRLPIIFDIQAFNSEDAETTDWVLIQSRIQSLRRLKNLVFKKTVTEKCLNLFQQ